MAMAASIVVGVRHGRTPQVDSAKRRKAYEEQEKFWKEMNEQAHYNELRAMLKKFDTDRSGSLEAAELKALLQEYGQGAARGGKITAPAPTDEEVSWILQAAGKHKQDSVNITELQVALDLWHSYSMNRAHIESIFNKYDSDKNNLLEEDQLRAYLTDINEGHAPSIDEVRKIIKEANASTASGGAAGIGKLHVMLATSLWYTHVDDLHGQCCVVS